MWMLFYNTYLNWVLNWFKHILLIKYIQQNFIQCQYCCNWEKGLGPMQIPLARKDNIYWTKLDTFYK